jgi:hypothetical protein
MEPSQNRSQTYLSNMPGTYEINEVQKTAILGTGHVFRKVQCNRFTRWFKYDRDYLCVNKSQFVPVIFQPPCNIGNSFTCTVNSNYRIAATLYFIETWFVPGISEQIPCVKEIMVIIIIIILIIIVFNTVKICIHTKFSQKCISIFWRSIHSIMIIGPVICGHDIDTRLANFSSY